MKDWTLPKDIKHQLERKWNTGEIPNALAANIDFTPLIFRLRTPSAQDIAQNLPAVRAWAQTLKNSPHASLTYQAVFNRVVGKQELPCRLTVATPEGVLSLIGKTAESRVLRALCHRTLEQAPFLMPWLTQHALTALAHRDEWDHLMAVVCWMKLHPRPAIYLRQVSLPGIHTKFIEQRKTILTKLFDYVLPEASIDQAFSGNKNFEKRYGFLSEPVRWRLRILDSSLTLYPTPHPPDIEMDVQSFALLPFKKCRVFIIENKKTFLAFPSMKNSIAIFGAGYCWETLKTVLWLHDCTLFYWGDIDTHGFFILSLLRKVFKNIVSFLMNEKTLLDYKIFWDKEPQPVLSQHALSRLNTEEQMLFRALQDNIFGPKVRLEQERIFFSDLEHVLSSLFPDYQPTKKAGEETPLPLFVAKQKLRSL